MTDSGFSKLPPGAQTASANTPSAKADVKAQVLDVTGVLRDVSKQTRIIGEIVRVKNDGTVDIRTAQGDLSVRVRTRLAAREGQRVEIDLPPGQPPKQATLRPTPPQQQMQPVPTQPSATPQTSPPAPEQSITPPQVRAPVPDQEIQAKLTKLQAEGFYPPTPRATGATSSPAAQPLPLEALVRLLPLPPASQGVPATDDIVAGIVSTITQTKSLTTQAAIDEISQILFQAIIKTPGTAVQDPTDLSLNLAIKILDTPDLQTLPQGPTASSPDNAPDPIPDNTITSTIKTQGFIDARVTAILPLPVLLKTTDDVGVPIVSTPQNISAPETSAPQFFNPAALRSDITSFISTQAVSGIVLHHTPQGLPVIDLFWPGIPAPQAFVLQFPASNLPEGSLVGFLPLAQADISSSPSLITTATGSPALPATIFELLSGFRWPVMDEALSFPQTSINAAQAQSNLAQILPQATLPGRIPAAALFFIAAVRAGDLAGWMGEKAMDTLRRGGRNDILSRIGRDFSSLSRIMSEPAAPQEWRSMPLPLYSDGMTHKIHLHYRHQDGSPNDSDDGKGGKKGAARFIFDLHLDRIGPLQLDGLARGKTLDLAVRTQTPFSPAMQQDMRRRYAGALNQAGLTGDISFQNRPEQWVKITPRTAGWSAQA